MEQEKPNWEKKRFRFKNTTRISIRHPICIVAEKKRAMLAFFSSEEYIIGYIVLWAISSAG